MTDTHVAGQAQHVPVTKHIPHQSIALALVQTVLTPGDDTGGVLATMLQHGQRIIDGLVNGPMTDNSNNTTHSSDHLLSGNEDFIALGRHNLDALGDRLEVRNENRALPPVVVVKAGK